MIEIPACVTIDFETYPIDKGRPDLAPEPVGVSIKYPGKRSHYYAWGHTEEPERNNCTFKEGRRALRIAWRDQRPKLFFNAKFDIKVAYQHMGLEELWWEDVHDAAILAYLADPHGKKQDLKYLADEFLDWPPEEKDEMIEWAQAHTSRLVRNYPWNRKWNKKQERFVNQRKIPPTEVGRWIFAIPAHIVGPYAEGDTDRTEALFEHLYPLIVENGMLEAYDRERAVLPIFIEAEQTGMRVDVEGLERDEPIYTEALELADEWLRARLDAPGLSLDNDNDLAQALLRSGVVPEGNWTYTEGGAMSVSKDNLLPKHFTDQEVAQVLGYRNRMATCLKMFMRPWLKQAKARGDGHISCNWNLTRGERGGTRTGRPSTTDPNFLNISKSFEKPEATVGIDYFHPEFMNEFWIEFSSYPFMDFPRLPLVRKYILPDEGGVFIHRDFDGQEMRIFGHYECGELQRAYKKDPKVDVHSLVGGKMSELMGRAFERTKVKVLNFQSLYGGGVTAIMGELHCLRAEAKEFSSFHEKALPGKKILNEEIKRRVARAEPIRTWGGRLYYVEEPSFSKKFKRMMTWEYKLINYLVQGSAADITKEALIRWYYHPRRDPRARFLVTVYDEINITCPFDIALEQMDVLREVMESIELDVQMLSSPKWGLSWGACAGPAKGEDERTAFAQWLDENAKELEPA